ncbi:MAG TPA: acyltransferase family protein, partial [Candidatus Acidoferrales bacterium]|nr:acyltransferase family protein [Candidatus Acidoferrales bacterium]
RNAGIDALRASLTLLVVFHHAAITYGAMGSWFYKAVEPSNAPSSLVLTLFAAYNQAFFMGLFFLIAGSLTPGAIARHGAQEYLRERLLRLGAPLLVFILMLGPVTAALAQLSQPGMRAGGKGRRIKAGRPKVSTTWRVAGAERPERER